MSDETVLTIYQEVTELYIRLFLMSIVRKCDFKKIVSSASKMTDEEIKESKGIFVPRGFEGLFFFEAAAHLMGSSFGEVYGFSERRQEELLKEIVTEIDSSEFKDYSFDENPEEGILEITTTFSVQNTTDQEKFKEYYQDFYLNLFRKPGVPEKELPELCTYYPIALCKYNQDIAETSYKYSITIGELFDPFKFDSPYVYDSYEVWTGNEGFLADFIEKVIVENNEEPKENHLKGYTESDNSAGTVVKETEESDSKNTCPDVQSYGVIDKKEKIDVEKPVVESSEPEEKNKSNEELVKYVWDDTRTIDLLDEFEGMGSFGKSKYQRLVIKNGRYTKYLPDGLVSFNLVIERGHGSDYVGDITFTAFKKGEDSGLRAYVEKEITSELINQYKDTDRFFRFSKPYLLRAQNSSNRTGYGWEWDWSGGYGDYTEGTLYGETTNYFFVGAYITSGYYNNYDPEERKPFLDKHNPKKESRKLNDTAKGRTFKVYQGKLKDTTQHSVLQRFLKIEVDGGWKYVPVACDLENNIIYINDDNAKKYETNIQMGTYNLVDDLNK